MKKRRAKPESEIRYLCLSDLHLGASSSLLTRIDDSGRRRASDILRHFTVCLRILALHHSTGGRRPVLLLNGDILELALARMEDALGVFQEFMELLFPQGEPDAFARTIVYLPGNHDHHIWELAREEEFTRRVASRAKNAQSFHTLPATAPSGLASSLLEAALPPWLQGRNPVLIRVRYPNLALGGPERTVIVHHGHFTEKIYYQISYLRDLIFPGRYPAQTVEDIEAENFAWIDFLWSTLGRSGQAGRDLELLYEKAQDEAEIEKLIYRFATNVTARHHPPSILDRLKAFFVYLLIRTAERTLVGTEVRQTKTPLSRSSWKTLLRYVSGPVQAEIKNGGVASEPLTFIFGHTHKPFQESRSIRDMTLPASILNSGGWVIETPSPTPSVGADVIVIDRSLRAHSIPVFRDTDSGTGEARTQAPGEFHDPQQHHLWMQLQSMIHEGIARRRARLIQRIQSDGSVIARLELWARRKSWKYASRKR